MIEARLIRPWTLAILLAGILFGVPSDGVKAQSSATTARASESPTQSLLDKAKAEESRGRMDLATQTWQQVLLIDPKNAEALAGLARAARLDGDTKLSDSYLDRLRAVNPNDPNLTSVPLAALTPGEKVLLDQASKLSAEGKYEPAMTIYRQVFGTHPPAGDWAVAYYGTESGTAGGHPLAVEGLRGLVEKYPSEERYQVALGQVLTYDPATREEGRKYLANFPKNPQAEQAYRQSLIWDSANPAVAPQIRAYLATHKDPQLSSIFQTAQGTSQTGATGASKQRATGTVAAASAASAPREPAAARPVQATNPVAVQPSAAPKGIANNVPSAAARPTTRPTSTGPMADGLSARARGAAEVAAYQALNAHRIDDAESRFKAILVAEPHDSKALAGMGYVRMQQGNFAGAISFLEQAKRVNADDKGMLSALDTARFWFVMGEGQSALAADDLATAEKRYRAALEIRPNNPDALQGLGNTLLKAQQPAPAIPIFEREVAAEPATAGGWRGLFMAQFRSDDAALAMATVRRIPEPARTQLMNDPSFLQPLASAYDVLGRGADAQSTLESALKRPFSADQKPLKLDIEIELAGIMASANHLDQAVATYRAVLAEDSGNSAAWKGLIRLQHAMGHDQEALQTIQSMPPATYATAMREPGFEITVASVYQAQKKLDVAQDLLQKAVTEQTNAGAKPSPAIEMQLADIYAQRGSPQLAYPVYQQVLRDNPDRADAWAGLLSALHVTGHDKEAVAQLKLIPPAAVAQLDTNQSYLQTMAAVYGAVGRSREATEFLGRVEQNYAAERSAPPADLEVQNAWLLYNGMDDDGLYRQLMSLGGRTDLTADQRRTVQTIWTNWAARRAGQATAMGNPRRALAILNAAARAFPDNPAAIKLLAIGYAEAGQPHQAVLIYKTQNMASASANDYEAAVGAALSDGDNKNAEIWMRYALAAFPSDPQILIVAARFEQARGDTARAIKYYRASLKAMPPGTSNSKLAADLGLPAPSAPSSLPSVDRPEDLSALLGPGNTDTTPAGVLYLPSNNKSGPLPPYDGTTELVPPYMTNPEGTKSGATVSMASEATVSPEVESAVRAATLRELGQTQPAVAAAENIAAANSMAASTDGYSPYVAYLPPPPPAPAVAPRSPVSVQLGNDTPHPVQAQAEVTDVLPTAKYGQSARANQAAASHAEVAAAQAARIRRLQEDSSARSGQSHPPPEETITGTIETAQYTTGQPQVGRPSTSPNRTLGTIPNTGAQQYPQPSRPPRSGSATANTRGRIANRAVAEAPKPAAAAALPATTPAPVATAPEVVAAAPGTPAAPTRSVSAPASTSSLPPIGPAYPLAPPPTDAELRARNLPAFGGYFGSQAPIPRTQRQQAQNALASLEGSYSGWLGVTGIGRYRDGTAGLDRLYDLETPTEASAVIGRQVRLTVVAEPVFLNSGVLGTSSFGSPNVPYLGTVAANTTTPQAQQFSNGIGGELQLTTKNVGAAVGYTPYEFLVRNVTGRFLWNGLGNHIALYGDREPVKDTQLSYAGLYDPGAATPLSHGPIWGGVVSTTGGVQLQFGSANSSFHVAGEGGVLTGQHVLDNYRFKGTMGASFRIKSWSEFGNLTIGGTLSGMHYAHDEVGLSYGQGGYFSPHSYFLASVPVSFIGHAGSNFHYVIDGSVGMQTFQQDAAQFFPLDPSLQSSLVASRGTACTSGQTASYNCGEYPLVVSTMLNYSFNSEASYRFGDHWYGGAFAFANNSSNFNTVSAGFFFRYVFRTQHSEDGYPAGLFQVDGLRSLQIP